MTASLSPVLSFARTFAGKDIDGLQPHEALHQEPGADEQHERQRHLRDDERVLEPAGRGRAGAAAALVQPLGDAGARGLQQRREPEEHRRQHSREEREAEHAPVDRSRGLSSPRYADVPKMTIL